MSGPRIEVQVIPRFAGSVDEGGLRRAALEALRREGVTGEVELALVVTDDEGIRELNRRFRGVDAPTDVLAFGRGGDDDFVFAPQEPPYLGDVIISYERALVQAEEQGHPVEKELALLVIHGLLHLLGYDDADEVGRKEMWARQEEILGLLGE